ncbi:MAG: sugar ABC transporter permease [Micromonosporaceae bacterium]
MTATDVAATPAVKAPPTAARRRLADREGALAWLFLMPSVAYIVLLVGLPFLLAIGLAFSDVTSGDPSFDWVGLRNWRQVFDDPVFWKALNNTLIFTGVSMVFIVLLGKVLANILVADFKGKWVVRFLVLLPWTTPVALSSIAWLWMLDSIFSPIDWMLRQLSLLGEPDAPLGPASNMYWLGKPGLAMASVIAVHVWRITPLAAVIMMAGLVAIPRDLEEAAQVDGAGYWRRMFEVTIPLVLPVAAVAALFGVVFTFTDFAVVDVLTRGGPNNTTQVLTSWAFFRGIEGGNIAQGAATALFMFPILLAVAIAILRAVRRMEVM